MAIIGVASRADEIGAGRIDAMLSATDVAKRFTAEMNQTARTLRQGEFAALKKLAGASSPISTRCWPLHSWATTLTEVEIVSLRHNAGAAEPSIRSTTFTTRACRAAVRSAEAMLAGFSVRR